MTPSRATDEYWCKPGLSQEQADARVRELAREYGLEWGGQEGE